MKGKAQALPTALTRPLISFDGRSASGSAACNTFQVSYASRGGILRFGPANTGKKSCKAILNTLERQYLGLLAKTNHYIVSGNNLTLYSGSQGRLLYTRLPQK